MADSTPNSNYIPSSSLSHSVEEDILTIDDQQTNNEVKDSDEVVVVVAPQAIVRGTFDTPQEAKQQAGFSYSFSQCEWWVRRSIFSTDMYVRVRRSQGAPQEGR